MKKALLALLLLLTIFAPNIASLSIMKPFFVQYIERKTGATVTLQSIELSWFGPQRFFQVQWKKKQTSGAIDELVLNAPFWSFSGPFAVKNGTLLYRGQLVDEFNGAFEANEMHLEGSHVTVHGTFSGESDFDLDLNLEDFPTSVLGSNLEPVLGPALSVKGRLSTRQTTDLTVAAERLRTHIVGKMLGDHLQLTEPLEATFFITPELIPHITSRNAAHIRLEKDFILSFKPEKLAGAGHLELNQLFIQNSNSVSSAVGFLEAKRLFQANQINLWCAPCTFSIKDGTFDLGRADFLLGDQIHLFLWGKMDLQSQQLHMYLGLPADTLQSLFGLTNLPPTYAIKVEVRGSIQDPEVVKGPALAKIAALTASKRLPKKGLFGPVTEIISHPKQDKSIPPAKPPFPWEMKQ